MKPAGHADRLSNGASLSTGPDDGAEGDVRARASAPHSGADLAGKVTVLRGSARGSSWDVDRPLAIGSHRGCDLHLRDASVSWNHARIWRECANAAWDGAVRC